MALLQLLWTLGVTLPVAPAATDKCPRPMGQDSLVGLGTPQRTAGAGWDVHYNGIATKELRYCYAGDTSCARDDSD